MNGDDFDGLVAVVTGGASGIGLATALELAGRGARVAVLDLNPEVPAPLDGFTANVADRGSVDAVAAVGERFGRIDILINNAGIGAAGTVADNDDDEWARVLNINVTGMARVSAAALPWLRRSRRRDREHQLDRGAERPAAAGAVLRVQGRRARADPGDGHRPRPRGHPRQLRLPRHRRPPGSTGCSPPPTTPPRNAPRSAPARPSAASSPRRSPTRSATSPARSPAPPPAPPSTSTAAPPTSASDPYA